MSRLAGRCPASASGRHQVVRATADVCYIDDRRADVDLDVTCDLCGANGHCLASAVVQDIDWTFDTDEELA